MLRFLLLFFISSNISAFEIISQGLTRENLLNEYGKKISSSKTGNKSALEIYKAKNGNFTLFSIKKKEVKDIIHLKLSKKEEISSMIPFLCLHKGKSIIAIFNKKNAIKKGRFSVLTAWEINSSEGKFKLLENSKVSCRWSPGGDEVYPAWRNK